MGSVREIRIARRTGFCYGVREAIDAAWLAADRGEPTHTLGHIVHNDGVIDGLRRGGIREVEGLSDVVDGGTVVIRAHGVTPAVMADARDRGLNVIDGTCSWVTTEQRELARLVDEGYTIVLLGTPGHPEVVGLLGFAPDAILVDEEEDVHRVVLAWRAWDTLSLTGPEHAHTLLRQSVRYCVDVERRRAAAGYPVSPIRDLLPRLLDEHRLLDRPPGDRRADECDLAMDYDTLAKAGSMLGSGGMVVLDETTDMVKFALRIMRFYQHESCGWCIPCREGTTWLRKVLQRFDDGGGRQEDIPLIGELAKNMFGRTFCALGDAAAMPTMSIIEKFRGDFEKRLAQGTI